MSRDDGFDAVRYWANFHGVKRAALRVSYEAHEAQARKRDLDLWKRYGWQWQAEQQVTQAQADELWDWFMRPSPEQR